MVTTWKRIELHGIIPRKTIFHGQQESEGRWWFLDSMENEKFMLIADLGKLLQWSVWKQIEFLGLAFHGKLKLRELKIMPEQVVPCKLYTSDAIPIKHI